MKNHFRPGDRLSRKSLAQPPFTFSTRQSWEVGTPPVAESRVETIRTMVINDSLGLLDDLCHLLLGEPGIDLAGVANHGDDALDEVGELHPQVIVLTLHLRGMNGFATSAQLRQRFPGIFIIMISAADDAATVNRCRSHGADDCVARKRVRRDLLPAIQRVLGQSRA